MKFPFVISHTRHGVKSALLWSSSLTIASLGVLLPALSAQAGQDSAANNGFILPNKNIYCLVQQVGNQEFLRCEIASTLKPQPPKSKTQPCALDWGNGLVLPQSSKTEILCAGDTIASSEYPTLTYDKTWRKSGFTCSATENGLTCTNSKRKGFFLNREEWRTF